MKKVVIFGERVDLTLILSRMRSRYYSVPEYNIFLLMSDFGLYIEIASKKFIARPLKNATFLKKVLQLFSLSPELVFTLGTFSIISMVTKGMKAYESDIVKKVQIFVDSPFGNIALSNIGDQMVKNNEVRYETVFAPLQSIKQVIRNVLIVESTEEVLLDNTINKALSPFSNSENDNEDENSKILQSSLNNFLTNYILFI